MTKRGDAYVLAVIMSPPADVASLDLEDQAEALMRAMAGMGFNSIESCDFLDWMLERVTGPMPFDELRELVELGLGEIPG